MSAALAARARGWVAASWWDPLTAVIVVALAAVSIRTDHLGPDPHPPLRILFVLACGAALSLRRRHAVAGVALVAVAVGAQDLVGGAASDPDVLAMSLFLPAYGLGAHAERRTGAVALAALLAVLVWASGDEFVPVLFLAGPWAAGTIVRSRRQLVAALAERTRELQDEQDAFARLAVRHERARIARELHDIVAHNIAVMVVQAGAGRMAGTAEGARERFADIHQAGRTALLEMDRLVDVLHADGAPGSATARLAGLPVLLDQARRAGLRVRLSTPPLDAPLPRDVEETAYRVVQEGLTNALKHAPGADVAVRLAADGGVLEIEVVDAGRAGDPSALPETGAGLGLRGMRERVQACGGELEAGPAPAGGWQIRAELPIRPAGVPAPV
jgi:signal transduction histidine kinase